MQFRALSVGIGSRWSAGALVLAMATGCPGDDSTAEGDSTGADSDGTSMSTTGGGMSSGEDTGSGGSDSSGGTGADSGSDTQGTGETDTATDTGMEVCQSDPLEAIGSILQVVVDIENDTEQSYWVIDSADACDEYELAIGAGQLWQSVVFSCGCECPGPPHAMADLIELLPGETHTLRWDGRALVSYPNRFECGPGECFSEPVGVRQPVAPAQVTMTVPVYDEAEFMWPLEQVETFGEACPSPLTIEVPVALGTDDIQIDVALSTVVP